MGLRRFCFQSDREVINKLIYYQGWEGTRIKFKQNQLLLTVCSNLDCTIEI